MLAWGNALEMSARAASCSKSRLFLFRAVAISAGMLAGYIHLNLLAADLLALQPSLCAGA